MRARVYCHSGLGIVLDSAGGVGTTRTSGGRRRTPTNPRPLPKILPFGEGSRDQSPGRIPWEGVRLTPEVTESRGRTQSHDAEGQRSRRRKSRSPGAHESLRESTDVSVNSGLRKPTSRGVGGLTTLDQGTFGNRRPVRKSPSLERLRRLSPSDPDPTYGHPSIVGVGTCHRQRPEWTPPTTHRTRSRF